MHLEMDICLDVNDDIEQLSRLNQLGHFNEAICLFHERLASHVDFFPVTAEYADLSLEQGNFGVAHAFISARLDGMASIFSTVELRLLRLLKAFAEIYTKGALIPALQMTKQTLHDLETEASEDPSFFKSSIGQHIQLVILPLMGDCEGRYIPDGVFEGFFHLPNVGDAKSYFSGDGIPFQSEDQQVVTELGNATLLAGFLNSYNADESVRATQRHFFEKARSIAVSIASEYPHVLKSRPYLNWLYLAETEVSGMYEKLSTSNSLLFFPPVWCRDSMGGVQSLLSTGVRLAGFADGSVPAGATTFLQETNIRIIMAAAEEQGDYKLQIFLLQALLNNCAVIDWRTNIIKAMSKLRQGVMKDAGGYLQCLIAEWRFFIDSNPDATSETIMNLYSRIAEFNDAYPSHFDFKPEERQRLKLILFDVPIFVWMKHLAMERLLRGMNRNTEADISRVRNPLIERHLPFHVTSRLGMTLFRCAGCVDCGGDTYPYPYHPHNLPVYGSGPYTQYPPDGFYSSRSGNALYLYQPATRGRVARGRRPCRSLSPQPASSPRDLPQRVSRPSPPTGLPSQPAIEHETYRYHTVGDETASEIEEIIRHSRDSGGRPQKEKPSRNSRKGSKREKKGSASKIGKGQDGKKSDASDLEDDDSSSVEYDS
ncbi:uncharacterized protein N7473_006592 [Penicillium subrubescens]|uniref:uncharacterized protein n=1 Tax=Penicillium subrubescens TaxID=1316194 RepID=UPI002544F8F4|nr:uncharacterized protein N7473_006592 [Penicillium subrubescens]KAJ5890364.1 hypothetical protein N7473_006592 [Penicillium subrubescens]